MYCFVVCLEVYFKNKLKQTKTETETTDTNCN